MSRAQELVGRIEEIMAQMDPMTREIFLLHRVDAWPYARIARGLGIEMKEVEQHLALAIAAIDRGLHCDGT